MRTLSIQPTRYDSCLLNVTHRYTLNYPFNPYSHEYREGDGHKPDLPAEPDVEQLIAAAGRPGAFREIVFSGLGEPTLRLYTVLAAGTELRQRGAFVRLQTDGLANLIHGRDVTPDLEGCIDALSIALMAHNEVTYNRICRPPMTGAYAAVLDFAKRAREFVPNITLDVVDGLPDVDIPACQDIAARLGASFRRLELGKPH